MNCVYSFTICIYILKGNAFGKGEKNAEKMRKLRWKEELIHMMDADGDGEVQPD